MRRSPTFDMPLFICFIFLVGLGITCVYTASYPKAIVDGGSSFSYAGKQTLFALIGLIAMFACMYTPLSFFHRYARVIGIVTVALLVTVLAFGKATHGNTSWLSLGPFKLQPSELAKVAIIIILAAFLAARPWAVRSWKGLIFGPYLYLGLPLVLIIAQGDLGTATVFAIGGITLLAIAGTRFRFWGVPVLVLLGLGAMVVLTGHRADRIEAWRNPLDTRNAASFQPRYSLLAIGSGGLFGEGFCQSRAKWSLPGAHNDYIFAVIAEELGLFLLLLFLFVPFLFLTFRGFTIAHRAPDEFSALVAAGCTVMLVTQTLVNMFVDTNLFPCMGITLPFISYGGSSLMASMMMAGLLLNVSGIRLGQRSRQHTTETAASVSA